MHARLLDVITWLLFLGGIFGLGASLVEFFGDADVTQYGTLGIGGGVWLLSAAVAILIRHRVVAD